MEYLDDLLQEHLDGVKDHTERLAHLIKSIERDHPPSAALTKRLENARRMLRRP